MPLQPKQLWLLKSGPVVEVTKVTDLFVYYEIIGMTGEVRVLQKSFDLMKEREWALPRQGKRKACNEGM